MIDLTGLNEKQRAAASDTEGSVLVFAGAGSGKTRVLTMRIANIVESGLARPYEVLAITFTNKAANEMKERLKKMLPDVSDMWICTIHSMCTRILRRDIDKIGYDSNFSIYSDTEKSRLIKAILNEKGYDAELNKKCMWAIGNAKSENISPDEYERANGFNKDIYEITEVFREYEKQMAKNNALDFDDLLIKTYLLLSSSEETRNKYSQKFKYIHIDEFQDTNDIQYKIVKLLYKNHKNIFAVGDDDQSIYGFRGANVNNILHFSRDFDNVKIYKLEQNYRSTKKILEIANAIIKKNPTRAEKNLWCDNPDGVRVEYNSCYNETEEGSFVAGSVKSLVTYSGYKYKDIAVLYRINALSRSFEQEFLKYNVPCKVFGGQKFYERKEIKDLTAYLRAVCNPKDSDAIKRIINVPKRGIGDTTVDKLSFIAAGENLHFYEVLEKIDDREEFNKGAKSKLTLFRNVYYSLLAEKDALSPLDFVKTVINRTEFLMQFVEDTEENTSRKLNISEFVASVKEFTDANENAKIEDFLESITLSSAIDDMSEADDAVTLATVHSVKGLEFKVVFIVGLDEKIFPIVRPDTTPSDVEEERRLMYVAVTRAMERLYLTHSESRYSYYAGERMPQMRSRFIDDVKDKLGIPEKPDYDMQPSKPIFTGSIRPVVRVNDNKASSNGAVSNYNVGDKVEHKTFGRGTVIAAKGSGDSAMVDVAFKGFGVKTLVLKYAPLRKV